MASAVMPILATEAVVLAGGWRREQGWPSNGVKSVAATIVLVIVASAANDTKVGPVIRAVAWLTFLGALYATVTAFQSKPRKG